MGPGRLPDLQYDQMLGQLPDGLLVTGPADTIRWANRGAAEISGWAIGELQGMRLERLISRDELAEIARARGVGDPRALERYHCLLRTKSDERREVSVSVGQVGEPGSPATIFLLRDIRRQRELERRLLERLAEKHEVEAFGRVASLVIHDLRNLNNILGITVRNFGSHLDDPDFRQEGIRTLEAVSRQMKYLMNKLSGYPTRISLHRETTTLGQLVHDALDLLARGNWQAEVTATVVGGLEEPLPCEVDSGEMGRVLFNVLLNAYEAVEQGGRVSITGHAGPTPGQVRLIIEDSGAGIPQSYLEGSLFRPFRSTKPRGWGLGLYHAKSIVEAHGGTIEVVNREEGKGTRVTITLFGAREGVPKPSQSPGEGAHASAESPRD